MLWAICCLLQNDPYVCPVLEKWTRTDLGDGRHRGGPLEEDLRPSSLRSSPMSLAPPALCVQRVRPTVLGHGCDLAFCPGTTPSGGQLRCVEFEARRALSGFKVPYFAFGTTRDFVTIVPSGLPLKQFESCMQLLSEFKRRHSAASQRRALRGTGLCCPPPRMEPLRQCHGRSKKQPRCHHMCRQHAHRHSIYRLVLHGVLCQQKGRAEVSPETHSVAMASPQKQSS